MPRADETPRDLLFGLLALQNGLIDQDQLVAAFGAWSRARGKALAQILVDRGDLDEPARALLASMAEMQLKKHGGNAQKSLSLLVVGPSTREKLAALGDTDLTGSVALVAGKTPTLPDGTATLSIATATADGHRFRILRPHAKGGLGAVFVALDAELNREVALKQILDHHADDPASRTRFLIEAEITGGLEHPGIVPVYGLGHYDDGRPYYAMRFIRGDSLKDAIISFHEDVALKADPGKRSLALRKLLRRFGDVCNAIDYAHGRGVLHRDLKPGNVIVGKHGETLVVDWGLAKPMGKSDPSAAGDERTLIPSSSSGSAETLPGSAIGTPAYMSPEQAAGDLDRLGPRSDVYSLGATLYCLLTGQAPFEGESLGEVLRNVRAGAFPPPRQVDPSIDPALEAVCLKAMATCPEDRYASARVLAEDVERWSADEPVTAWREPLARRARRWARRNRTLVTAASAAVMVATVGLGVVLAVQSRANVELRQANAQVQARFELAREAIRAFEVGVGEEEILKEDRLKPLRDKLLRSAVGFYEKLEGLLQGKTDRASRAILAESYGEVGQLIEKIGAMPEALAAYRKAVAILRELASGPHADGAARVELARALNAQGKPADETGDHDGALAAFREARDLAAPLATGPGATASAREALGAGHFGIGAVSALTGNTAESLASFRAALVIQQALARDYPAVAGYRSALARSHRNIGMLLSETGQPDGALASFREALAIREALARDNPAIAEDRFGLARSQNEMGGELSRAGQYTEALACFREALATLEALARDNPAVNKYRSDLAVCHKTIGLELMEHTGRYAESLAAFREALAISQALARENPTFVGYRSQLASSYTNLGTILYRTGQTAGALASYREALAIDQALARENPAIAGYRTNVAVAHANIGELLSQIGQPAAALASLREALAIREELARENPTVTYHLEDVASILLELGYLRMQQGDPAGAIEEFAREQSLRERLVAAEPANPDHRYWLANCRVTTSMALLRLGRADQARSLCEQSVVEREQLITKHPESPSYRLGLGEGLLRLGQARHASGDPAGAVADFRQACSTIEAVPEMKGEFVFYLACSRASLSSLAGSEGAGVPAAEGPAEADRAMALLRRAAGMGFRDPGTFRTELALDALRGRADFRLLMMDLTFPERPFAAEVDPAPADQARY
jgi:tetratricopeptide (TPR) repeat protein/tRNA A-37 threonylcarbamoyl transferase component Bud32